MERVYHIALKIKTTKFVDSKIYQYCQNNIHNKVFTDIMQSIDQLINSRQDSFIDKLIIRDSQTEKMCLYYDAVIKNDMADVVREMIDVCAPHEMMTICLAAIINESLDIIEILTAAKFDFNVKFDCGIHRLNDFTSTPFYFMDYAIYHKKIKTVQYLLDAGIKLNIVDKNYDDRNSFLYYLQTFDDEIFNLLINSYPQYHQSLLIISIYRNKLDWVKCLFDSSPNISIDQIQYYFAQPVNDNDKADSAIPREFCKNISVDVFKLLVDYDLEVNYQLYETIFDKLNAYVNVGIIDYLMAEYHFVPTQKLIKRAFKKMNVDIIKLLVKYNVDLSQIRYTHPLAGLIDSVDNSGLDPKTFLCFVMKYVGW